MQLAQTQLDVSRKEPENPAVMRQAEREELITNPKSGTITGHYSDLHNKTGLNTDVP